jgi:hypothetical protein
MNLGRIASLLTLLVIATSAVTAHAEPPTPVYETLIGGYDLGYGRGLVLDDDGSAFVIASTYIDEVHLDVLVFKISPAGDVVWTRLIHGAEHDFAEDLAIDDNHDVIITGWTDSADYPTTPDAMDPTLTGFRDIFVTRLSGDDGSILYSTFLGGDYTDTGMSIELGAGGEIYLAGSTGSTDFPTTADAYQSGPSAPLYIYTDAFITVLDASGTSILYSTYFGGYKDDAAYEMALDQAGNIVFAGRTNADDFPLMNPIMSSPDRIFVARLSADGSTLQFGTYLGGEDLDSMTDMALDSEDFVYLTGATRSTAFPTTPGAFQEEFAGEILGCGSPPFDPLHNCEDGFVTKLGTGGEGIVYSTYMGGQEIDESFAITVEPDGCAIITGQTRSPDFPGTVSPGDLFISKLGPAGTTLEYTYRRQSGTTGGRAITNDGAGDFYLTGSVLSVSAPHDIYVARFTGGATSGVLAGRTVRPATRLGPSTPNPFATLTRVSYSIAGASPAPVRLAIYDATGRVVDVLVDRYQPAGSHSVTWDGTGRDGSRLPSGVYFYQLQARGRQQSGRVLMVR